MTCYTEDMTKAALHQIVEELPETQVDEIAVLIKAYRAHDPLLVQCLLAEEVEPEADETPATEEDLREGQTLDEVCAELGLHH
jgi:hypothetical protein